MTNEPKQPDYNRVELNHIRTMYEEAKAEYPRLEHSGFMMMFFRFGGDEAHKAYWNGERHMPTWTELKGNQELSDLLASIPELQRPLAVSTQPQLDLHHVAQHNKQIRYQHGCGQ